MQLRTFSVIDCLEPAAPGDTTAVQPSVLLIEDDLRIRRVVQLGLAKDGFDVAEAPTGEDGLAMLGDRSFDVVCVDVMLPGCDGFAVCHGVRRDSDIPIIMVTARADSHDVVRGLEAGADDYVSKPFMVPELSARIRALLRRAQGAQVRHRVRAGDLEIAPRDGVVLRGGRPLHLTRTEFRILCELAAAPGRVCSRAELLERVWGHGYFGDSRPVDVHIGRLRRRIEADPGRPEIVLTARGLGYRLQT
ncbi:response regulator transcription factor [Pseudonocardia petroleophila]